MVTWFRLLLDQPAMFLIFEKRGFYHKPDELHRITSYDNAVKPPEESFNYLEHLRRWRGPKTYDHSLAFMAREFDQKIAKPFKQLQNMIPLWYQLIPDDLAQHTSLESLRRGVLQVAVDSSAHLYELDRLLRNGLERDLIRRQKQPVIRRIKLRVNAKAPQNYHRQHGDP